ncbi:hypothetical protein BV22DRAFT_1015292 [Leucogyrophana mollusca]|uniref:Uncharacterized protein n=1 Tax=Leucogyrophana mollusca TaxID=85980 RepID=A0ACB8BCH3_9AGAM|nr:hypothetical protein BV22DRAFT_1015292 [Leucogyrophana mollusca]
MTSVFSRQILGLRPSLTQHARIFTAGTLGHRSFSALRTDVHVPRVWPSNSVWAYAKASQRTVPSFLTAAGIAGVALGITAFTAPTVHCDSPAPNSNASPFQPPPGPPPTSSVNLYELSFGTVCGICAGVFIKKGARLVAFFLGGVFVLLQYLGSMSLVRVDWARMGQRFENLFYTRDALGQKRAPTIGSLWRWMVDFLTADFQSRASFIAGLALGLRVG